MIFKEFPKFRKIFEKKKCDFVWKEIKLKLLDVIYESHFDCEFLFLNKLLF